MKRLVYLFITFLILSCNPKISNDNIFYGSVMFNAMNGKYSMAQFDSMCVADTLPRNMMDWEFLGLVDYESRQRVSLFSYYKKNVVYRIEDTLDDSVKIIKRQVK